MKSIFVFTAAVLVSGSAFAGEYYKCTGTNEDGKAAELDLSFETEKEVTVVDPGGTEITLDFDGRTSRATVYADYGYDGYGGSVVLKLPKNFAISGGDAAEEFKASYKQEVYSEAGHVATVSFKGECQRQDN